MELIFILIVMLFWLTGFFLLWKISFCTASDGSKAKAGDVTIIIPARNEAHNLPKLLLSLRNQSIKPGEILVVNDQSKDLTSNVAKTFGATVIEIQNKPSGWNGKSYACWKGAQKAKGTILLFLDADTTLEDNGLHKIISSYLKVGGLLSVQPYHQVPNWSEKLSAILNVMVMAGFNTFTPLGHKWKPPGSFGPCIICSKSDYFSTGGHEAVKSERLEDIPFGQNFMKHGFSVHCYGGKGAVSFRMYPNGLIESVNGWAKSFAIGASSTHSIIMLLTIAWISGGWMAVAAPFVSTGGWWLYCLFVLQMYWILRRIGSFGMITALLYPLALLYFISVYCYSFIIVFIKKQFKWKGRIIGS